ncbi:hypothetical protein TWF696_008006 [Orbilia brochopaga]|uniref:Uncharacterized protein n=1 Tax=Orbilia brochopaga TaxID=3140254 RepID=A0AAV9ULX5_9PEZI
MSQNANAELPILPAVEQALRPFIKSPAEITLTRRHLSSTLDTLIAASASQTQSLTAQRAARCLTGTRKAYYSAAVENLRLRKQWAELVSDITLPVAPDAQVPSIASSSSTSHGGHSRAGSFAQSHSRAGSINRLSVVEKDPSEWTAVYDQVLELRRVFSQLTVLSKYQQRITALAQSRERPLPAVFADYAQRMPPVPPGGPLAGKEQGSTPGGAGGGWDEEVLLPLEKAVVDAQKRLQTEKEMLVEAKAMVARQGVELATLPDEVRTAGMVAAKEELEVWLDEQLRLAGEGSGTPRKEKREPSLTGGYVEDGKFDMDEKLGEIKRVYESYVTSREKLLHAFLLAIQPVKKEVIPPKTAKDRGGGGAAGGASAGKNEIPALLGVMDELGHWKARMDELTELMKGMKEGSVNAARDLEITMGKLHSESQLLENYGRGGVTISRRGSVSGDASPFQSSIELAKAWEQAAEEAERAVREEVGRDTVHAKEKLAEVDELIEQLKNILPDEASASRRDRKDVRWRGLRGNVGFDDDL